MLLNGLPILGVVMLMTSQTVSGVPCEVNHSESGLHVDCKNRRITSLQNKWYSSVAWMDFSVNMLADVSGLTHQCFSELRYLNLSRNLLHFVPSNTLQHLNKLEWLDLSYNNLGFIPSNAFQGLDHLEFLALCHTGLVNLTQDAFRELPRLLALNLSRNNLNEIPQSIIQHLPHLKSLNLNSNAISIIKNRTFASMTQLLQLGLQDNALIMLEQDAFVGLGQLVDLDLSLNRLILNHDSYPAGIFTSLVSLQNLIMHGNDHSLEGRYPENVFTSLTSLKSLKIDTFHKVHFGSAFFNLTNLTSLDLSYNCKIIPLSNLTFVAFHNSSLNTLIIKDCRISHYEMCVFCFLPRLQTLDIQNNVVLNVNNALQLLYGLQFQNMSTINLQRSKRAPSAMDSRSFQYLNNICVESVSFNDCRITHIPSSVMRMLFEGPLGSCIKELNFERNFLSDVIWSARILMNLYRLPKLQSLRIQNQLAHYYTDGCFFRDSNQADTQTNGNAFERVFSLRLPPTLRYLDMSGIHKLGVLPDHVDFLSADNLNYLGLSTCGITRCNTTISGVMALETLDLSNNVCKVLSANLFRNMTSLRTLKLSYLSLDQDFMESHGHDLLGHLHRLEYLDLSDNDLERLPVNMLAGQLHLTELLLAKNRFQNVPVNVSLHPRLGVLDLSKNIITSLSLQERNVFDALASNHTFYVRMRNNLFACTCSNMDFIQWLANTEVRLDGDKYNDDYDDNGRSYPCVSEDGTITNTRTVNEDFIHHWRRCVGERTFWAALSALCLQLLALFSALLLARSWTHVRYVINVLRKLKFPRRQDFWNDAYVVYGERDTEKALAVAGCLQAGKPDIRLLLRDNYVYQGGFEDENIVNNIDNSWKIVILATSNLMRDRWTPFIILQAQHSITDIMPDRVIIVFAENPVRLTHMTSLQHLLRMVPERNVFYIPQGNFYSQSQWDQLIKAILYEER